MTFLDFNNCRLENIPFLEFRDHCIDPLFIRGIYFKPIIFNYTETSSSEELTTYLDLNFSLIAYSILRKT